MQRQRRLVVTGASTGFGRAIAEGARSRGWEVLGTVRTDAHADALHALGIASARLDLAAPDTVANGCADVLAWCGGELDAVVHNAGTAFPGPVELLDPADLRRQFEINTFGHVDVTQRLLPAVRAAQGRMLYVSSDSATVTPPFMGAYAASKRALEALAESLAQEVEAQGVSVVVVAPGPYATSIWESSMPRGDAFLERADDRAEAYRPLATALRALVHKRPQGDASDLARVVLDALDDPHPPFRIVAPWTSRAQGLVRQVLGARTFHALLRAVLRRAGNAA